VFEASLHLYLWLQRLISVEECLPLEMAVSLRQHRTFAYELLFLFVADFLPGQAENQLQQKESSLLPQARITISRDATLSPEARR
jgi:hypothetical protein